MDVLITTPFHPAYMTAERLNKAKKLKLIVTAGVGSDHVDLNTAAAKGLTVSEVSGMIMNFNSPQHKEFDPPLLGGW
jgi:formate dehydrogenase